MDINKIAGSHISRRLVLDTEALLKPTLQTFHPLLGFVHPREMTGFSRPLKWPCIIVCLAK